MWLVNALGILPIAVGTGFAALVWQCAKDGHFMWISRRYPRLLFDIAMGLVLTFTAAVFFAGGVLLLIYEWPFPIERVAP